MAMGRPRTFDRQQALERAVAVFWEHGYEPSSIALLCERMRISTASLYSTFGDKRRLFGEVLDHYLRTYGAFTARALADEPTAHRAVSRLLHDAASAYTHPQRPPGCLLITAATNCGPQSSDIQARLRDIRTAGRQALERTLTAGVRAGELSADTDCHGLATFYQATIHGMSCAARDGARRDELEVIAATALNAWPCRTR